MSLQSALDFANMISGYCRVHGNSDMMLTLPIPESAAGEFHSSYYILLLIVLVASGECIITSSYYTKSE